jgi:hypothetical protein
MSAANEYVLAQGLRDTRATLSGWQRQNWSVLRSWTLGAVAIACLLLSAVWIVVRGATPEVAPIHLTGVTAPAGTSDVIAVLGRNSLVLAFHATACVAGFIAGASMPIAARTRTGFSRWVHLQASKVAILLVGGVTLFSLTTQAYILGSQGSTIAYQLGISPGLLILSVVPHALPELTALFLPLAAWLLASRNGDWNKLLAATFVTVGAAIPVLVLCAVWEVYIWPRILIALSPIF